MRDQEERVLRHGDRIGDADDGERDAGLGQRRHVDRVVRERLGKGCEAEVTLAPGEIRLVDTGLVMELPEGIECQVRPRSGLALKHGLTLPNSPGTIDPDYRGELRIIMQNTGAAPVTLSRGERVAQLVFARFAAPEVVEAAELSDTERGAGGFGSTGVG